MIICLGNVLSSRRCNELVAELAGGELFEPGVRTAGVTAKQGKVNLQGIADKPAVMETCKVVREALLAHPIFKRATLPAQFSRLIVSRYETGMAYGSHFDDAFIGRVRTDVSSTVFLSDPDGYQGGELSIQNPAGSQAIKLPAGSAVVYPSDRLHAVQPVESGVRLAVVGWLQSRVRPVEQREILYELSTGIAALEKENDSDHEALLNLKHARNNLFRLWMDG